jgi:NhaA family Na+:H+ antiporter
MPIFALANAGVAFGPDGFVSIWTDRVAMGILLGLVIGKQVGVLSFSWLAVKVGLAALPTGVNWRQLYGVACLAGIGFTMSLFIANLAFDNPVVLDSAKLGILVASVISGLWGWVFLSSQRGPIDAANPMDESGGH